MKHSLNLSLAVLCAILVVACTSPTPPERTEMPVGVVKVTPSLATAQVSSHETVTNGEATQELPITASISPCEEETILFTAKTYTEGTVTGGLYSICIDGTGLRQLLASAKLAYDELSEINVSPDGRLLALSAWQSDRTRTLLITSLETFCSSELVTDAQGRFSPQWSADGEYLAYLLHEPTPSPTPPETHLEIVHLASGTVSEVHLSGLSGFNWSPDSSKAVFSAWIAPDEHSLEEHTVYVGDIVCEDTIKRCELEQVEEIDNVGDDASWIPGTQTLVSVARLFNVGCSGGNLCFTDIEGNVIQEFEPSNMNSNVAGVRWPNGSADGRYIGFISLGDLYVIDLDKMTLQQITFDSEGRVFEVIDFDWMPVQ